MQRRVPQILGIYLATSWAIVEFLDWLINQFSISPHLAELVMIILASMIPTVVLIAYYHGKPGRDTWTKVEKIGIPINLVGAILLLIFVFKGKTLGATTAVVNLENEEGQMVEMTIPKPEFRKKIMLFFMENQTGDTALNWLSYGFSDMLHTDLTQDYYMEAKTAYHSLSMRERMLEAGYEKMTGLPLMLEKEIAGDQHLDYFLTGAFTKQENLISLQAQLYRTRNGKLVSQHTFTHENVMNLADQLTAQIKMDLEVPAYHLDEVQDLPVSEISTSSLSAYRWYTLGSNEATFHKNWDRTIYLFNKAIQEDPTFALAYYDLYNVYLMTNQSRKGAAIFQPLMDHLYKLPEKLQYQVKASYFEFRGEYDKQYALFEMLVNLYPEDIKSRLNFIFFLKARNQIDDAIAEYEYILQLDPERYSILKDIGSLYEQTGRYEDALTYYQRFAEQFPDNAESFRLLGGLHLISGEFEEAKASFEQALMLEPDHVSDLLELAGIAYKTGNFEGASQQYQNALELCYTPREKAEVYEHLANFHELKGERKEALENLYLKYAEWEKLINPLYVTTSKIGTFDQLARLEKKEVAFEYLQALEDELDTLLGNFIFIGYLYYYLEQGNAEEAEKCIKKVELLISELKLDVLQHVIHFARAQVHTLRGEYDQAVPEYMEQMKQVPADPQIPLNLSICYRKMNDLRKAQEYLEKAFKLHPFFPQACYEMALVYQKTGKKEKALQEMQKAVSIWENADPDFEPALLAREKLNAWR